MKKRGIKMSELYQNFPFIKQGVELERARIWPTFLQAQQNTLRYLYSSLLTEQQQSDISFQDWCRFAFSQTSTDGLRSYQ